MFVGIEIDPDSGSLNNDGSVFVEYTLKKAVKRMKTHLTELLDNRENLEDITAYIIDVKLRKIVVDLAVYQDYAELQASIDAKHGFKYELPRDYYDELKMIAPKNLLIFNVVPVFKRWSWK